MRCGLDVAGAFPSGTEITKGINEPEPKSDLDFEKTSGNSERTAVRWPHGSNPCREGQTPPSADATANVPRREGTKRAIAGSDAQAVQARARRELRGGEAETAEIEGTSDSPEGRLGARLSCCKTSSGTLSGGAWATARISPGSRAANPNEGKNLPPGGDEMLLNRG